MKNLSKLLVLVFSLSLLAGCNFLAQDAEAPDAMDSEPAMEEAMEKDGEAMEEDTSEALDAEVEAAMDEEEELDKELDALEEEGL